MTIKEIEQMTEMTRANIRFYEAEGMISPLREKNGYRKYSIEDVECLKKIKLLRALHVSLENIKELQKGTLELSDVLLNHIDDLEQEQNSLVLCKELSMKMYQKGFQYENLKPDLFLEELEEQITNKYEELEVDRVPKICVPWRRFLARYVDIFLYEVIVYLFIIFVLKVRFSVEGFKLWTILMPYLLMLFLEPLQLMCFKTTVGKCILGIYVTNNEYGRLNYKEGFLRTFRIIVGGMGLLIPFYNVYCLYRRFGEHVTGVDLDWEYDSTLIVKDMTLWRGIGFVTLGIVYIVIMVFGDMVAQVPANKGELTQKDFCENYRHLVKYFNVSLPYDLDDEGRWFENQTNDIYLDNDVRVSDLNFELENDEIISVDFSMELVNYDDFVPDLQEYMYLITMAYVGGQENYSILSTDKIEFYRVMSNNLYSDFHYQMAGVQICCEVEHEGFKYLDIHKLLVPEEGNANCSSFRFEIEKKATN